MVRTVRAWVAIASLLAAAGTASAQQNLFNVPSGRITDPGELFIQEQFNLARPSGASNTTFDFGLPNRWEVGFNVYNVLVYDRNPFARGEDEEPNEPSVLFNAQKGFELVEDVWSLGVGGQFGANAARLRRDVRFQNFLWAVNEFTITPKGDDDPLAKLYAGLYYANQAYAGPGDRVGGMFGVEVPLVKDRLSFQADWLTGNTGIGIVVVGGVYTAPRGWQLSVGAQLPTFRSDVPHGLVIEFTVPGYPLTKAARARRLTSAGESTSR